MSNIEVIKSGQKKLTGDERALFQTNIAAEIMTIFETKNIMMDLHEISEITEGKSDEFPLLGKTVASYHVAGTPLLGNNIQHNNLIINIDSLLESHVYIYDLYKAFTNDKFRAKYVMALAEALAKKFDKQTLQVVVLAARSSANLTGEGFGGTILKDPTFVTDKAKLAAGLYLAKTTLDEKDVPSEDRTFVCRPALYNLLSQNYDFINTLYGGEGNVKNGEIFRVAGFDIIWSNNVPKSDIAAESGTMNTYSGDFSDTVGVAFHKSAIGTVKLLDVDVESSRELNMLSDLVVSTYAMGHGILRPEAAVEFSKEAP